MALQYATAAVNGYARRLFTKAREWHRQAIELDSAPWSDPVVFGEAFALALGVLQNGSSGACPALLGEIVTATTEALPDSGFSASGRRRFRAHVLAALFFRGNERADAFIVGWAFPRLLVSNLRWAANPGVWSIGVRALFRRRVWAFPRRLRVPQICRRNRAKP